LHQAHGSARAEANRKSVPRDSEKQAARLARRKKKAAKRQRPPSTDTVEMVGNVSTDTKPVRNSSGAPSAPPALAGYTFLEGLGCSMLADVWKVRAPDGQLRLVHFIYGLAGADPRIVEEAIYRLRALHHPALAHCEVVHTDPGRLVLVTELIEQTLRERLQHCQGQRLPGIPHDELLGYLRTVAEAVDYLYQQHSIHHLGLNPRALLLQDGRVKVAEFGLAHLLWVPAGQVVAQRNVRYAAPELFERLLSRTCDQYSLALIYQELLTGVHPFQGQTRFVQGWTRVKGTPDVSPLSAPYREVLARALDNDPLQRWPSCTALVQALEAIHRRGAKQDPAPADAFSAILNRNPAPQLPPDNSDASAAALNDIISSLIHGPGNLISIDNGADNGSAEKPGAILRYRFRAGLPLGAARQKLDAIRQHWYGQPIRDEEECLVFHVSMPSNFWRQWIGRQPGIEVQVQLARVHPLSATPIEVNVQIRTFRCNKKRGVQLLEEMGKPLLDALRAQLLVNAEKRTQERLLWPHALQVCPIGSDGKVGKPVRCRGKDISLTGIGFYLPHELPTANVLIQLPTTLHPPAISVPATLVRAQRCADGSYEVGALFQITTLRKSLPEFALQE
jgi:serine/threonine protein kinase